MNCTILTLIKRHSLKTFFKRSRFCLLAIAFLTLSTAANAQESDESTTDTVRQHVLSEVEVNSKQKPVSKTALSPELSSNPSSVSVLGRDYVAKQAVNSYGDLLRPIAGVNVANYQLGGVGYGIEMRGYVVTEHAKDVAFFIDGVPQNQGSSIEANGYADLNPLIPEIIRSIEVVRGPFSPIYGDHAMGGGISFHTEDRQANSILVSGGTYGFAKVQATCGFNNVGNGGYITVEGGRTNGYRDNSAERHVNGFAKFSFPLFRGTASIRLQDYSSTFGSAGYLNRADVDAGTVDRKTAVGATDGGSTNQQNAVFNYHDNDTAKFTSATAYVQHHDFVRIRTGVIGGAQREERDNRVWTGFDLRHTRTARIGNMPILYYGGVSLRADFADESRFVTVNKGEVSQNRNRTIDTYTPSAYVQLQLKPVERLKITLSARYDQLQYNIKTGANDSEKANVNVSPSTGVFSPKAGVAFLVAKGVNVFANVAQGFKAPSGYEENIYNPSLNVSKLTSYEIGIGGDAASGRYHGLVSGFISDQTGEIQSDPLGNLTNFGNTRRSGVEAEGRVNFGKRNGFGVFANYTNIVAKITNGGGTGDMFVTNTPTYLGTLGFDYDFGAAKNTNSRLVLSVYDQLIGPKNLNEDGSMKTKAFQRISGRFTYTRRSWANFRIYLQGTAYPGGGELEEMSFLSSGSLLVAPQAPFTLDGGVKIPF